MPKLLQEFYDKWNPVQQQYYKPLLEAFARNNILTYSSLRQRNHDDLHKITDVSRPIIQAFVKQIQYDNLQFEDLSDERHSYKSLSDPMSIITSATDTPSKIQYLSTGFESLDKLLSEGLQFGQLVEICGDPTPNKFKLVSHLLLSFASSYNKENIHLFDVSGLLEPKRLSNPFLRAKEKFDLLAGIECRHVFNVHNLLQSMENLAALLLSKSAHEPVLIVVDDLSRLIEGQQKATEKFIRIVQTLCGKLNCCIVNMHHISKDDMVSQKQNEATGAWDSIVDLKLYVEQVDHEQGPTISVEILKSRDMLLYHKRCILQP